MTARKKQPAEIVSFGFVFNSSVQGAPEVSVRVSVDYKAVALQLIDRAEKSKSGKARGLHGAVTVAILKPDDV